MKLKVHNTKWPIRDRYFFEVEEFHFYEGDEVKVKWCKPEEIAISTGNPEFAFRIIQRRLIAEMDGKPYEFKVKEQKEEVKLVTGSNGKVYEVTSHSCTCPGFTFRGSCKHIGVK